MEKVLSRRYLIVNGDLYKETVSRVLTTDNPNHPVGYVDITEADRILTKASLLSLGMQFDADGVLSTKPFT
jgi:hypothetical protein